MPLLAGVDLAPLKRALDANDLNALNAFLAELLQRRRNELLRLASEESGFETYEVDGVRYMLASELSLRVYRYVNPAALCALLARYDRPLKSLRSAQHDVVLSLEKAFGLHSKAAWTNRVIISLPPVGNAADRIQRRKLLDAPTL